MLHVASDIRQLWDGVPLTAVHGLYLLPFTTYRRLENERYNTDDVQVANGVFAAAV